jgi:hypothetical protein
LEKWRFINISGDITVGITDDDLHYISTDIDGWNDNENFNDLVTIVTIRATRKENNVQISLHFEGEGLEIDQQLEELISIATKSLKEEVGTYLFE